MRGWVNVCKCTIKSTISLQSKNKIINFFNKKKKKKKKKHTPSFSKSKFFNTFINCSQGKLILSLSLLLSLLSSLSLSLSSISFVSLSLSLFLSFVSLSLSSFLFLSTKQWILNNNYYIMIILFIITIIIIIIIVIIIIFIIMNHFVLLFYQMWKCNLDKTKSTWIISNTNKKK